MKKLILIFVLLNGLMLTGKSQVGIGNPNPSAGSILDLTNTNDKALLLPRPTVVPSSVGTFTDSGMVFYYNNNIHLRTSSGIKVLSPWNYDGVATNGLWSPSGTPVGIGVTPVASSPIRLQVANGAADVSSSTTNGGIAVGTLTAGHLLIDSDELLAKTNATTAGTLKLQDDGGTVEVRASSDAGVTTVLTAYGSVDAKGKMKENGNDLIPVGTIVMYNGSTAPSGWARCDGGTYALQDGSGNVVTPDLRDRFITGTGSTYTLGNTGGENTHTLTVAEMPSHNHSGSTSSDGAHTHTYTSPGSDNNCWCACACTGSSLANPGTAANTGSSGAHTHTLTINNNGGGTAHENRPPYYALMFIMKL